MKLNLFATLSLGALSALLTATSAYAQHGVEANVPFAFSVGSTQMPAGTYTITVNSLNASVQIHNTDNSATIFSHAQREYPGEKNQKLVFRQVHDQYFLAEIWGEKGSEGMMLGAPKPQAKPKARVEEASQPTPPQKEVMIALK
jgi:hypothetical protein